MIARCVNQINDGHFAAAEAELTALLKRDPKCYQALVARGTCRALAGSQVPAELRKADADFSKAINAMPHLADVWKRRSQARAALGQMQEATTDLENALCTCAYLVQPHVPRSHSVLPRTRACNPSLLNFHLSPLPLPFPLAPGRLL
jgi:Tfp pilus assembly protein PilF